MSIIAEIIGRIAGNTLEKRRTNRQQIENEAIGYIGVAKRIRQSGNHFKYLIVHIVIFFGLARYLESQNVSEYVIIAFGFWGMFVLMPHFFATFLYRARWSLGQLSKMSPSEDYLREKAKRKPKRSE